MKTKISILTIAIIILSLINACDKSIIEPTTQITTLSTVLPSTTESQEEWITKNRVIHDMIPEFEKESIKTLPIEEAQREYLFQYPPSYRKRYYELSSYAMDLVDDVLRDLWWNEMYEKGGKGKEPKEMVVVSYIKYFRISKADFKKAVEKQTQRDMEIGKNISDEENEPYNADIIYTFDNEIINEYYRRR